MTHFYPPKAPHIYAIFNFDKSRFSQSSYSSLNCLFRREIVEGESGASSPTKNRNAGSKSLVANPSTNSLGNNVSNPSERRLYGFTICD